MLECNTNPLPDHIHDKFRKEDEIEKELEASIQNSLTKLISQLNMDNRLGTVEMRDGSAFLTLTELCGSGTDQCGFKYIARPNMNQSICVYGFSTDDISNQQEMSEDTVVTYTVNNVSKAMLLQLAVQSIRQNVEEIAGMSDITNANGSVELIWEWAQIAFWDSQTHVIDQTQQRAFEVIMSTFVISFHNEADRNVQMTGTIEPHSQSQYNKLQSNLGKLYGQPDPDDQMIMFLTGPHGSGKMKVINSILSYAKRFCEQMQYVFDK